MRNNQKKIVDMINTRAKFKKLAEQLHYSDESEEIQPVRRI